MSSQMTLTADELIFHKICANYDIETILGRFGFCAIISTGAVKLRPQRGRITVKAHI